MLLYVTEYLARFYSGFHVFQYLTLRGILAAVTALALALLIGPPMIAMLSRYQIGQHVRTDGPQSHLQKSGTPTMGGGLILVAAHVDAQRPLLGLKENAELPLKEVPELEIYRGREYWVAIENDQHFNVLWIILRPL